MQDFKYYDEDANLGALPFTTKTLKNNTFKAFPKKSMGLSRLFT